MRVVRLPGIISATNLYARCSPPEVFRDIIALLKTNVLTFIVFWKYLFEWNKFKNSIFHSPTSFMLTSALRALLLFIASWITELAE